MFFLSSFAAHAITKPQLEALLREKGIEISKLEAQGMQIYMGEVTGHLNALPFSKVQILVTEHEAILKSEIDSVDFSGAQNLGSVVSVRFNGQYLLKQDVKATISMK